MIRQGPNVYCLYMSASPDSFGNVMGHFRGVNKPFFLAGDDISVKKQKIAELHVQVEQGNLRKSVDILHDCDGRGEQAQHLLQAVIQQLVRLEFDEEKQLALDSAHAMLGAVAYNSELVYRDRYTVLHIIKGSARHHRYGTPQWQMQCDVTFDKDNNKISDGGMEHPSQGEWGWTNPRYRCRGCETRKHIVKPGVFGPFESNPFHSSSTVEHYQRSLLHDMMMSSFGERYPLSDEQLISSAELALLLAQANAWMMSVERGPYECLAHMANGERLAFFRANWMSKYGLSLFQANEMFQSILPISFYRTWMLDMFEWCMDNPNQDIKQERLEEAKARKIKLYRESVLSQVKYYLDERTHLRPLATKDKVTF